MSFIAYSSQTCLLCLSVQRNNVFMSKRNNVFMSKRNYVFLFKEIMSLCLKEYVFMSKQILKFNISFFSK